MLLRSSTTSNSNKLQALHMMNFLVEQWPAFATSSFAAILPLLGALVSSSKAFQSTSWDGASLAMASELLPQLVKEICNLVLLITLNPPPSGREQLVWGEEQLQQQQEEEEEGD